MSHIVDSSWQDVFQFRDEARSALTDCASLEDAAQGLVELIYEEFSDSIVLAPYFATILYRFLPTSNQAFVRELVRAKQAEELLTGETPVLSLLGTCGSKVEWNDRRKSKAHLGIPLVSASFVEEIPMLACLLKELEFELECLDSQDTQFTQRKQEGAITGLFYVRNAASTLDARGRLVIPAQDFVVEHNIKTVFGLGGIYHSGTFFIVVAFTHDIVERTTIAQYASLVITIQAATTTLDWERKYFRKTS
jgi:hypothetical protein